MLEHSADLTREAQAGRITVATNEDGPLFLAVPFDELLLKYGVNVDLAVKLLDAETISLGKAAKLAGMPLPVFMDHLKQAGVPIARAQPGELEQELATFGG